jgi:methyl-accepting chemotaxis protein
MSIANRLIVGFGIVIALIVALGLYGLSQVGRVRDTTEALVSRDIAMLSQLSRISDGQNELSMRREAAVRDVLARRATPRSLEQSHSGWRQSLAATETAIAEGQALASEYASSALSAERAQTWRRAGELLTQMNTELGGLRSDGEEQFTALQQGNVPAALELEDALTQRRDGLVRLIGNVREVADEGVVQGRQRVGQVYDQSRLSTLIAIGIAIAVGVVVTFVLRRSIVGPLQTFMAFVERVGRGDLAGEPAASGKDEIGRLGANLNDMVAGLKQLAMQSREATANLGAAISEIRASTQEQAAGVEEQLAAVQETAATVDEITHAGSQVTKRAQEVIAAAQTTAQTSADGLRAVDETARVMDSIREQAEIVAQNIVALSEKTQAIGEIISTVNDISERSHLLALNAAIEAAAAGESGRSFTVVASEMKLLADQAKDATNQVRSILGDVQRGINTSVMLTEEAVKRTAAGKERTETTVRTIGEITGRIQESVQTFQQIVASTNQQQLGIEQVMGALTNIRQASQQTAAGTRQLDEAAANLASLSQQLQSLADRYKI